MDGKFQLNDILLRFKSPRPAAMMIERSTDFGQTWKPYQYFADDCAASFPQIQTGQPRSFDDVRCQEQPRNHASSDEQVTFNPLKLADYISGSKSNKINNMTPFTNLRINFIKPYKPALSQELSNANTFYAVYDMKVQGSCFCNGHASSCTSEESSVYTPQGSSKKVKTVKCVQASTITSPGNQPMTTILTHVKNATVTITHSGVALILRCTEPVEESVVESVWTASTIQWETTVKNANPLSIATNNEILQQLMPVFNAHAMDWDCNLTAAVIPPQASVIVYQMWWVQTATGVLKASGICEEELAVSHVSVIPETLTASAVTRLQVSVHVRQQIAEEHVQEQIWKNVQITITVGVHNAYGAIVMKEIVDNQISTLNIRHKALVNTKLPAQGGNDYDSEIGGLTNKLQQVQVIISNPAVTDNTITDVYNNYNRLRTEADQINFDTNIVDQSYRLRTEMDVLNNNVKNINSQIQSTQEKIDIFISEGSQGTQGTFNNILSSYLRSGKAKDRVVRVEPTILKSREARLTANQLTKHLNTDNRSKLEKLKDGLKSPNINPLINKVCGGSREEPCTPEKCHGDLCPAMCEGINCQGTRHLAEKAIEDAERGSTSLPDISNRITQLTKRLENTDQKAQQMKNHTLRLTSQIVSAKDQMHNNIADIKTLINTIKGFLTSAQADPDEIQRISEHVLSLKLPTDAVTIGDKITSLRNIASRIPDVSEILANTQDDVAKAKMLLENANKARQRASRVKDNINEVQDVLADANKALQDVSDIIEDATEAIDTAQAKTTKIEDQLTHTETNLQDITDRLRDLTEKINNLQNQNDLNRQKATDLESRALDSRNMGDKAEQDFKQLVSLYEKLQNNIPQSLPKDLIDRVNRVRSEADYYFKEVQQRLQEIGAIEQNLAEGNKQLEMKSAQLEDYQDQVTNIKKYIESRAQYYDQCTP
ncbi:hypothetical protein chiPu_0007909 [Chiloscyllium punctatum]|uniref:Laminin N-terminal domain-containing protein n=1 Tax=Chiloscyllium punctatum TaxID=137246 RepID=A0A401SGE1_CHIPU|nr:hypothetical protein [Chiloscyllium punctatum]